MDINGLAIIAGSTPSFSATIGKSAPTVFAITTTNIIVSPTIRETCNATLSKKKHFRKATIPKAKPHISHTVISLSTTFAQSLGSISWVAIARMTKVDAWLPAFPPESVSIGTNILRAITALTTYS